MSTARWTVPWNSDEGRKAESPGRGWFRAWARRAAAALGIVRGRFAGRDPGLCYHRAAGIKMILTIAATAETQLAGGPVFVEFSLDPPHGGQYRLSGPPSGDQLWTLVPCSSIN